ncbi:MAG: ShlB/FhaC/HecB family hemolysin secretion/activation protein [Nitrospina sp.]|jgi:hemolysin activation/secretion protein|nr:ShlB/FhaC/HecB family hemolysin secretion/activation protein [Nitrospina sp.]MBT3876098.1 ShlB/FhaC/HecB family hemolysin secretion/activation protein [Nitrospina sp.]MBT4048406.1 ShlB/FhaC/HecB family hemolysin secretion/activation protein [Nitrospina sp.]MBT4556534.1 ShlB/FhaC/HecB family hemolysin secretion/activation protein [Nitrospina sp.]MBT5653536.1 ShlB/FhaC/HecB family hemolysin secretion/activation protein [Nitrospina sp.]
MTYREKYIPVRHKIKRLLYFTDLIAGWFLSIALPAWGQTDAGIIEKSLRQSRPEYAPPPEEVVPDIEIEDSRELIDAGAGPTFFVREIKVTGNTLISTEKLAPLLDVGEGDNMTLGILTLYANEVTAAYATEGYFLARAFIPAQEIKNGVILLQIVEGKLGNIEVKGNVRNPAEQFIQRMQPLRDEEVLSESALERVLLELNSLQGIQVRSVLQAGELPGTTDLILNVTETRPYTFSLDVDNFGSRFTGPIRVGMTGTVGNLFKLGDQFSLRIVESNLGQDYFQPTFLFPITDRGTTVKASFTHSEHALGQSLASLRAGGKSQIFSLEVNHPLQRSRTSQLFVKGGLQVRNYTNEQLGKNTSDDRLVNIFLGVGGNFSDPYKGRNFFDVQGKSGFSEGDNDENLNSRTDGRGDVAVFNSSLTRYQNASILHKDFPGFFIMKASGQFALDRVLSPDQTSVGGFGSVRGFALSEFSGDHGYNLSMEYNYPITWKAPFYTGWKKKDINTTLLAFIDHGKVFVDDSEPGEDHQAITGAGFGVKISMPAKDEALVSTSFSLIWGVPVMSGVVPSDRSFGTFYLSGLISY